MRKIVTLLASSFVAVTVLMGLAAAASADTPSVTISNPVFSQASSSATVTGVAAVTTTSKTQGEYISATGYHPKHPKVTYIKKGKSFSNSLRGRNGATFYFHDVCGSSLTPAAKTGAHKGTCEFYWDATHKTWRKPTCGNYVKLSGTLPKLTYKSVTQYKSFSNVTWHVAVKLTESGKVSATATCTTSSSSASGTAEASASASVTVTVTVAAKYSTTAKSSAGGKISSSTKTSLSATVKTNAEANLKASASASCSGGGGTTTPPPVVTPSAPTVTLTAINDVDAGGTSPNFCVSVNLPGSDTGMVSLDAKYGSFSPGSMSVSGLNKYCQFTYQAPDDSTAPNGLTEQVSATVRDNTSGLSGQASESFPIGAPVVHP